MRSHFNDNSLKRDTCIISSDSQKGAQRRVSKDEIDLPLLKPQQTRIRRQKAQYSWLERSFFLDRHEQRYWELKKSFSKRKRSRMKTGGKKSTSLLSLSPSNSKTFNLQPEMTSTSRTSAQDPSNPLWHPNPPPTFSPTFHLACNISNRNSNTEYRLLGKDHGGLGLERLIEQLRGRSWWMSEEEVGEVIAEKRRYPRVEREVEVDYGTFTIAVLIDRSTGLQVEAGGSGTCSSLGGFVLRRRTGSAGRVQVPEC